jgi:hypothetical protein
MANENGNGVDITDDLISGEPTVREEIVSRLEEKNKESEQAENAETSGFSFQSSGNSNDTSPKVSQSGFDPSIHETNADGTPRRTKNGDFRRKRGRRGNGTNGSGTHDSNTSQTPNDTGNASTTVNYTQMGEMFAGMLFSTCVATFGNKWEPKAEERSNITNATARYCESVGMQDIPPGIALVLCVGMYALPRFNDPETKAKIRDIGESMGIVRRVKKVPNINERD